jgi:hypothetical protein
MLRPRFFCAQGAMGGNQDALNIYSRARILSQHCTATLHYGRGAGPAPSQQKQLEQEGDA